MPCVAWGSAVFVGSDCLRVCRHETHRQDRKSRGALINTCLTLLFMLHCGASALEGGILLPSRPYMSESGVDACAEMPL